ncbi:MAG: tetratricopeptide repeat protein [Chlorobiaceae bacterium]|nr:tetratricopeptide repeat protein [Chlorobiaceae bacterium]
MPQEKKDFFISYTGADRQWAEWIAWHLEQVGYSTIIQAWDFRAGGNFILEMHRAAIETNRTIAVLSERYQQALYTQPEWAATLVLDPTGQQRRLIPVRIEDVKPEGLFAPLIYIDLAGLPEEPAKEKLLADIQATMSSEPVRPKTAPGFPGGIGATPSTVTRQPRFPGTLPPVWNVPSQRNPNFTGREEVLTELREQFKASSTKQIIHGLGGVGKSQIAAEFCYRNGADYDVVWWLHAEEESSLIADFTAIAKALKLPEQDAEEQEVVIRAVRQWLDCHDGWLLIFDNARNAESLRGYLPQANGGHALITTRNPDWRHVGTTHEIVKWPRPESVAFLQKRTGKDDPAADGIAKELDGLPLALEQAGAYICQKQKSLAEYLADFQQFRTELWKRENKPSDYPDTVATTWLMAFEAIENVPLAKELLLLCSVVAPDNIPKSLVKKALEYAAEQDGEPATISTFVLDDARGALCSYSLITADTDTFSIHRLVQTVAQDRTGEDEVARYRAVMLKVLSEQFPNQGHENPVCWVKCEQLLPHAYKIADEKYPSERTAILLHNMGMYCNGRAFYAQAELLLRRALEIIEGQLGSEHFFFATCLNNLAGLLQDEGKYSEAECLYRRTIEIHEKHLGKEHPTVAISLNNLAVSLKAQGKEVEALYQISLKILEEQLGGKHPDVATTLDNLAQCYLSKGRYSEGEVLCRRALTIREELFGRKYPTVANSLNTLTGLLIAQKKYVEAELFCRRALEIWEEQLGGEHPHVASSLDNLGGVLQAQGKYVEAELLCRRALKIREDMLDEDHPDLATSFNNLGGLLKVQGKFAEAEPLYLCALQICEKSLGASHPYTMTTRHNLAALREKMKKQ